MKTRNQAILTLGLVAAFVFLAGSVAMAADVKLAWDPNSEPDLAGYKVYHGTASRAYGSPSPLITTPTYTVTGLPSGKYYFAVTALNRGGLESGYSNEVSTTISSSDSTPPVIAITSPTSSGSWSTSSAYLSILGTSSDDVGVTQVTWANSRGGSGTASGTTSWSVSGIVLQLGANVITVTARDAAGNTSSAFLTATFTSTDTTAPKVAITSPTSSGTYTVTTMPLSIGGTASDDVGVAQVTWSNSRGGSGTATGTTNWSASVALRSGTDVITVTASDAAGNSATATLTVTYTPSDSTPPKITITSPTSSGTYTAKTSPLTIGGTASDNIGVSQVTWSSSRDSSGTAVGTTNWSASVALLSGSNVISVTAWDAAGNCTTATLTVSYTAPDSTPPTVTITAPTPSGSYTSATTPLSIGGTASDNIGVTQVSWSSSRGGSGTATGTTTWSASVALQSGPNVITVTARDAAGNTGTATLTVTFAPTDLIAPTIFITSPTSTGTYTATSSPLSVGGTASDNVAVTQVTWFNNRGGSGTATGTTNWHAAVTLQNGSNILTLTAHDAAGNLGTATLTVSYTAVDTAPPVISGVDWSMTADTSVNIHWNTNEPATSWVDYGTSATYGNAVSNGPILTSAHQVPLSGLDSKTLYHFRVKSVDGAGNVAVSNDHTFTISAGHSQNGRVLTYPRPIKGAAQSPGTGSDQYMGVALTNLNTVPANLTFTVFDSAGTPLSGDSVTNPATRVLQPGQQLPIVDIELFGAGAVSQDSSGWIKVESDVDGVVGFFLMFNSTLQEMDGANLASLPLNSFVLPEIQDQGFTQLSIVNSNQEEVSLVLDLMKADGTIDSTVARVVPPNGALAADVLADLFAGATLSASNYIRVTASAGAQPFEMIGKPGQDMAMLAGLDRNSTGGTLYSPQYVVGGPWRSTLSIINLDSVPGTVTLTFFAENGSQIGATRQVQIAAQGKLAIDDQAFFATAGEDILQGYLQIVGDGVRLTGSVTFGDALGLSFTAALPLVSTLTNSLVFSQVASNDIYFTGIALVNPGDSEAVATVDVYSAQGGLPQNTKQVRIPARQRYSGVLTQFFTEFTGIDLHSGYIRITVDKGVASFALFGTNNLSVLSAIPPQTAP
jgi:hypothetical protein